MSKLKTPLQYASQTTLVEAGCDEAGRGCLAGPVVAAAVILPPDFADPRVNDSKQLSESARQQVAILIKEQALAWAIAECSPQEIDTYNILRASIMAMHRALDALSLRPQAIAVDGNKFYAYHDIPHQTFVKGDGRWANIAAASILAKTHRDHLMEQAHLQYPQYHWDVNKGYPTQAHRDAIAAYGPSPLHRRSFRLLPPPSLFDQM